MTEIHRARIHFGPGVSPEDAEEMVTRALRLASARMPEGEGALGRLTLPPVALDPGAGTEKASEALATAILRGVGSAKGGRDA